MDVLQYQEEVEEKRIPNKQKMTQYAQQALEDSKPQQPSVVSPIKMSPTVIHHQASLTPKSSGSKTLVVPVQKAATPSPRKGIVSPKPAVEALKDEDVADAGWDFEEVPEKGTVVLGNDPQTPESSQPSAPPFAADVLLSDEPTQSEAPVVVDLPSVQEDYEPNNEQFSIEEGAEPEEEDDQAATERAWQQQLQEMQTQTQPPNEEEYVVKPPQQEEVPPAEETPYEEETEAMYDDDAPHPGVMDHDDLPPSSSKPVMMAREVIPQLIGQQPTTSSNTTTQVPEHVLQQFSQQLKRLEDNHLAEQAAMQRQNSQEKTQLQQQIQQAQQLHMTDEREWKKSKEYYTLQLDALKRELEGTQQLLEEKGREDRKKQETFLHQLRGMEKQMNKKQDESQGHGQKVKELQVSQ
jgi:hypothetical protein